MKFIVISAAALVLGGLAAETSQCVANNCNTKGLGLFQTKTKLTQLESSASAVASIQQHVATYMTKIKQKSDDVLGSGFADVARYVEEMAARDAGHNYTMTTAERLAFQTIETMMNEMRKHFDDMHGTTQGNIDNSTKAIKLCTSEAKVDMDEVATKKSDMEVSRSDHSQCRNQEVVDYDDKTKTCNAWDVFRQDHDNNKKWDGLNNMKINTGETAAKLEMENHILKTFPWLSKLHDTLKECKQKTDIYANKTEICKESQGKFEKTFCSYAGKVNNVCREQDVCRNNSIRMRNSVHRSAEITEAAIKADFKAGQKISCFLNVLKTKTSFESCKNFSANASNYSFTYHDIPAPTACDRESTQPCDSTWTSKEYSSQPWHSKVQMKTCDPCGSKSTAPGAPTSTTTTRLDVSFENMPIESLDLDATKLKHYRGGFHDGTYGYVVGGKSSIVRFELTSFNTQTLFVKDDVGIDITWGSQCLFTDGTHGFALQGGPYNQEASFKVVRFGLPNIDQVTKPLEIMPEATKLKDSVFGKATTYECRLGFAHKEHIFVHCRGYMVRFPKNSFDSTAAPVVETFVWPDAYESEKNQKQSYWVMNCGNTGFIAQRRAFSFELDNFGKYGKSDWIYPQESTSGACNDEYGFSVIDTGSPYQGRKFVRWPLSDVSKQKRIGLDENNALKGKVPGRPGFAATVTDGTFGYALPGRDFQGNYWTASGPNYHMARFNISDFTAETTDIIDLSKRNKSWTYFYHGFVAGSFVYMVPRGHTDLLRFPLVK